MMHRLMDRIDDLTTAVSQSPMRAVSLGGATGASGSAGLVASVADVTMWIQLAAASIGLVGACIGCAIGYLSLKKALRDHNKS